MYICTYANLPRNAIIMRNAYPIGDYYVLCSETLSRTPSGPLNSVRFRHVSPLANSASKSCSTVCQEGIVGKRAKGNILEDITFI